MRFDHVTIALLVLRPDAPQLDEAAAAALQDAHAHPPEVVLLDIGMPGMDGYELARRLRGQDESRDAVFVALTGYGEDEDRRRARDAGFDYHMVKPVNPSDLQALIQFHQPGA